MKLPTGAPKLRRLQKKIHFKQTGSEVCSIKERAALGGPRCPRWLAGLRRDPASSATPAPVVREGEPESTATGCLLG
jgi:hypothetical protein